MAETTEPGIQQVSEWAVMIENHGIAIIVCAILLMFGVSYGLIYLSALRREKSGLWIERKNAKWALKEDEPSALMPTIHELPKLTQHPAFALWESELRTAERFSIKDSQGNIDKERTEVGQDLITCTVRATRNLWRGILTALYERPDEFEDRLGDESAFRDLIGREYAGLISAIRQHFKQLGLPEAAIHTYAEYMDISDMIAERMLERSSDHPLGLNYFRLYGVLETQYARGLALRRMVGMTVKSVDCSGYQRKPEATEQTMGSFATTPTPSVHSILMDPNAAYKPRF